MITKIISKIRCAINLEINKIHKPVRWGNLRTLKPVSELFGGDRGKPIDRYYIEKFLQENSRFIKGAVLEILDDTYTKKYGNKKVTTSNILDIDTKNKKANIYADLRNSAKLPKDKYDCIILTQTLHEIDDSMAVLSSIHKMLKSNGVLLCTVPSVSRIDFSASEENDFWRFTKTGVYYLFKHFFKEENIYLKSYGNVLTCISFLEGISMQELTKKELDYLDENFPMTICIKAVK